MTAPAPRRRAPPARKAPGNPTPLPSPPAFAPDGPVCLPPSPPLPFPLSLPPPGPVLTKPVASPPPQHSHLVEHPSSPCPPASPPPGPPLKPKTRNLNLKPETRNLPAPLPITHTWLSSPPSTQSCRGRTKQRSWSAARRSSWPWIVRESWWVGLGWFGLGWVGLGWLVGFLVDLVSGWVG